MTDDAGAGAAPPPFIAVTDRIAQLPGLPALLGAAVRRWPLRKPPAGQVQAVIAWGRKPSAWLAARLARRHGLPVVYLEDGFLRSVGLGRHEPPLSVVVDDLGVYYDASAPSRLEQLLPQALSDGQRLRAQAVRAAWCQAQVSKYNHAREYWLPLPERYVLAVDQVAGDLSIRHGLADQASFGRMLEAALAEHPDCQVLLKVHPGVIANRKRGHFDLAALAGHPRLRVIGDDVHPVLLLRHALAVYCVTSQLGFEGLLWGKPVRTFGMPFYGGWGLTGDDLPAPGRRRPASLEQLVHAALLAYPRYVDPETGQRCEVERIIDWLGLQRRMRERFPPVVDALGFSAYHARYKRPVVRRFFQGSQVFFDRKPAQIPDDGMVAAWRGEAVDRLLRQKPKAAVLRLEDGFIRSVGLGADMVEPLSWAMDGRGIYYDPSRPSDLEHLLEHGEFTEALLARAARLRQRIVAEGLTKYNVGADDWRRPQLGRAVLLVPGQVESDASLAHGAVDIRTNVELLRAVRQANPDAYIVYKPHPDVVAGLRRADACPRQQASLYDERVLNARMAELLMQVDEVHTITSLAGFEALLRGKKTVCYGLPFYAGWGLTEDAHRLPRRTRRLTVDQLVAAALMMYPCYVSRTTGRFTTPERALDELLAWRGQASAVPPLRRNGIRLVVQMEKLLNGAAR